MQFSGSHQTISAAANRRHLKPTISPNSSSSPTPSGGKNEENLRRIVTSVWKQPEKKPSLLSSREGFYTFFYYQLQGLLNGVGLLAPRSAGQTTAIDGLEWRMRKWLQHLPRCLTCLTGTRPRSVKIKWGAYTGHPIHLHKINLSTAFVRCGLSGRVAVDLHNVEAHPITAPLVIYLPPCPLPTAASGEKVEIPEFLQKHPVAVINYRWSGFSFNEDETESSTVRPDGMDDLDPESNGIRDAFPTPIHWPTPVHDTHFAYQWIVSNLSPSSHFHRDIYLYGTHLGATLAASLALTESFPYRKVAVRGVAVYNGLYNWTMFLPGHPIYKPKPTRLKLPRPRQFRLPPEGSLLHYLSTHLQTLFDNPSNMFDPFASPALFFHNPGMLVPLDFVSDVPAAIELIHPAIMKNLEEGQVEMEKRSLVPVPSILSTLFKRPRRSALIYPPRHSAIRIPESLFMHDSAPAHTPLPEPSSAINSFLDDRSWASRTWKRRVSLRALRRLPLPRSSGKVTIDNTFEGHAVELARLMRNSVNKHEFKQRKSHAEAWEIEAMTDDAEKRVKITEVKPTSPNGVRGWTDVPPKVEGMAANWLSEQIQKKKVEREAEKRPWWRQFSV
ncbi:bovine leukaemia virus receptor (BLVR) domain-containing protein [Zalerion maritima]|uniref:Leukaemia virus receptor (BLVR) domain-containing protein n=1 Tax=Zalerion maritima TaxID=339359 RepID=A0AAD5WPG9_9PEZI|nr:bovine leukaemia virus receptor (BLVR) domain-containing protein [Zalerion maritima]